MPRQLPLSLELEELVLGTIINAYAEVGDLQNILDEDDFTMPGNKEIFRAMTSLSRKHKPIGLHEVFCELLETDKLEKAGGQQRLAILVENPSHCYTGMAHLEKIVKALQLYTTRRKFAIACLEAADIACDPTYEIEPTIQSTTEKCLELLAKFKKNDSGLKSIVDIIPDVLEDVEKLNSDEDSTLLDTGILDLDKITGGIQKGVITILAGRTSSGKTTVALDMSATMAMQGKKVAIFSMEMTEVQVSKKLIPRVGASNNPNPELKISHLFKPKGLRHFGDNLSCFSEAIEFTSELDVWIDDCSSVTTSYIRSELSRITQSSGCPDAVVIDYVGLIIPNHGSKNQTRAMELDSMLKELRAIAKDFNIAMICLAQINRGVETRNDKRPKLADMRESGGIEQEAALVIGIYNPVVSEPDVEHTNIVLELLVLKNRFGQTGKIKVGFQPEYNRLLNLG